jgi:hypothetical protein
MGSRGHRVEKKNPVTFQTPLAVVLEKKIFTCGELQRPKHKIRKFLNVIVLVFHTHFQDFQLVENLNIEELIVFFHQVLY